LSTIRSQADDGNAVSVEDLPSSEMQGTEALLLAPVPEVDERNVDILVALDIPPPSGQGIERRAYFLEGFHPRQLPPITTVPTKEQRQKLLRERPQVMVLETPPLSASGTRPLRCSGGEASEVSSIASGGTTPLLALCRGDRLSHPVKQLAAQDKIGCIYAKRVQEKGKGATWPQLDKMPKSKTVLPIKPALPKKKPSNFFVGGRQVFG
jgi:hypothetical protein